MDRSVRRNSREEMMIALALRWSLVLRTWAKTFAMMPLATAPPPMILLCWDDAISVEPYCDDIKKHMRPRYDHVRPCDPPNNH
eukprot:scaffold507_cov164-Chaetoceros_neogracile.AAC.1